MQNELLSLSEAGKRLPHRPAPSTIWRWIRQGIPAGNERIYLRYVRIGRRVFVPAEALEEFVEQMTLADKEAAAERYGDPARREADIEAAERRVMGWE